MNTDNIKRILIVKTSSLGDILQCYPVLDYLKKKCPNAKIDWVVEKPCFTLLSRHPDIDRVIEIHSRSWKKAPLSSYTWKEFRFAVQELRSKPYDLIFDFQGNAKSAIVTFLAKGAEKIGFSWNTLPEKINWFATRRHIEPSCGQSRREDYLSLAREWFQDAETFIPSPVILKLNAEEQALLDHVKKGFQSSELPVIVAPGSAWRNKELCTSTLKEILLYLQQKSGASFFFSHGSLHEKTVADTLVKKLPKSSVLPPLSLPLLQHVMGSVPLVITMDSLPLHLAASTNAHTLSFFGPSKGDKYAPQGKKHFQLQGVCPYDMDFAQRCPKLRTCPTGACLKDISLNRVKPVIEKLLSQIISSHK